MSVKLLLDENVSPRVAEQLRAEGIDACAVRDRGLLEATDADVFARAFREDRIVVTANVADFARLASRCELHAGLVLLERGDLLRDEQLLIVRAAVTAVASRGDLINTVLRIAADGSMAFEDVPPPARPV